MKYQFDITMTEEDYLAFNDFHSLESKAAQKQLNKSRIIFILAMAVLAVLYVLLSGFKPHVVIYLILVSLFTVLYVIFFKKIVKRTVRAQVKTMKKSGKLPFDPLTQFEFHEDMVVEVTPSARTERRYDSIQRLCIVGDRYLYLYTSSVGAYVLPIAQLKAQTNIGEFLGFLRQKCPNVEIY